jgi:hypothetical protein
MVGAGLAGIFLADDAVSLVERALPAGVRAQLPSHRWRIPTIGDTIPR